MRSELSQSLKEIDVAALLDCLPDPAIIIGSDHRILAANESYRRKFMGGERVRGRRCYEVSHHHSIPCDQAGEACPITQSLSNQEATRVTHIHHTPKGEEFEEVTTYPITNEKGESTTVLEVIRPVRIASAAKSPQALTGGSPAFRKMIDLVMRVAPRDTTVLLLGESGTGKELVARAIHEASPRAPRKFVPVDSSGLSETLFESELFGHIKGAFTGATSRKLGLVEACDGGTLFLDEVGDIPLQLQVKLLRLIETGLFRRVGASDLSSSDFRLVCATHRDLEKMVEKGSFRRDLYYRISTFPIELPPLRERIEDLQLLSASFGQRLGCKSVENLSPEVLAALSLYDFPGNVRELLNILERACLLASGGKIHPEHLPRSIQRRAGTAGPMPPANGIVPLAANEREYLKWAAATFRGSKRELARRLGVSERTLYRKLREAGVGS